jgi:hypothetical protein
MSKSKLALIGEEERNKLQIKNIYRMEGTNQYSDRHPNALATENGSDDPQNIKGKGTDQGNPYESGGGHMDIYGNGIDMASGRKGNLVKNHYSPENPYPFTSIE